MAFKPSGKLIAAGVIAATADFIQAALPLSSLGFMNPVNDVIDFAVGGIMVTLLGWHWAFMPSFMGKIIPGVDLVPFWTMAVFIVGMGEHQAQTGQQTPGIPTIPPPMPYMMQPSTSVPQKELTVQASPAPAHAAPPQPH